MSNYSPKNSSIFLYVPMAILAITVVGFIFNWQFKGGEESGASLPPPVHEVAADKIVNHRALAKETGLSADGKMLFTLNCASCHGESGQGDGPRGAGLNPPPRKYRTEAFKFGNDVASIYNTLQKGSPGTSMPSFALLPPRDLWAMVHYVRTMVPNATPTDDAIIAKLPETPTGAASAGVETADDATAGRIPIALAMMQVEEYSFDHEKKTNHAHDSSVGAEVYLNRCAKCHGQHGEGMNNLLIGVSPYRYGKTAPLYNRNAPWLSDRTAFDNLVLNGLSGRVHPGNGTLTRAQLDALFGFMQGFATN